jgi:hypothetical protein
LTFQAPMPRAPDLLDQDASVELSQEPVVERAPARFAAVDESIATRHVVRGARQTRIVPPTSLMGWTP